MGPGRPIARRAGAPAGPSARKGFQVPLRRLRQERPLPRPLVRDGDAAPGGLPRAGAGNGCDTSALEASPATLAPCHNDPWPGNLLDTGERVYVIDWEYSGMNDPVWDLADLSVEAGLGPEQECAMLEVYSGGPVPPTLYSRLELYKAMSDLHWALWGFVQHANGNPVEDFRAYALERLERCKKRVGSPKFGRHLDVVLVGRDGPRFTGRARRLAQSRRPRSTEMRDFRNAPPYTTGTGLAS